MSRRIILYFGIELLDSLLMTRSWSREADIRMNRIFEELEFKVGAGTHVWLEVKMEHLGASGILSTEYFRVFKALRSMIQYSLFIHLIFIRIHPHESFTSTVYPIHTFFFQLML